MRIVVDVMGGDHGCGVIIDGVKLALQANPQLAELFLVGRQPEIEAALRASQCQDARLKIIHASEVLTMEDKPLAGFRKKKDCSVTRAMELVRDGKADAVISSGNTGGLVAAATFILRRIDGLERPALAAIMPAIKTGFVLIDVGATPDCKPSHLLQFAIMGSIYSRLMLGHQKPRVGILSNGSEDFKGTDLTRAASALCRQADLNFIGYVEGTEIFASHADVVVTDGFIGNILLKATEGLGKAVLQIMKSELTANPLRTLGALIARGGLKGIKRRMDPEAYGGAPLLGLNGTVIKIHGSAKARVVANAIRQTADAVDRRLNQHIRDEVAAANVRLGLGNTAAAPTPVPA